MSLADVLDAYPEETFLTADGFDDCIIGVSNDLRLVYDRELIIHKLMDEMSFDDAIEYYEFNIESAFVGPQTPIFVELVR